MAKTDVRTGARAERTQNPTLGASYSRLTLLTCSISIVWRDQKFSGRGDGAPVEGRAHPAHPADLRKPALKKLQMLNAARALRDLLVPPGNRLERLHGDREGQYSIRINDQYRICFEWRESNAFEVEITDYH